jgi:hypothetical protein
MTVEIGFTEELTNSQYAPLAALSAYYQQKNLLDPLARTEIPMRKRDFTSADKLIQVLLSILAGCQTLSEVNSRLKPELGWHVCGVSSGLQINLVCPGPWMR